MIIHNALFLVIGFVLSFLFCFPIGPASLEVVDTALRKTIPHALRVGAGSAAGTALWATSAIYGGLFMLKLQDHRIHAVFMLVMSLICLGLGLFRIFKRRRHPSQSENSKQNFSGPFKGFALSISNPIPLVSWSIVSGILPKFQITTPNGLIWTSSFFTAVWAGSFSYQSITAWFSYKWSKKHPLTRSTEKTKSITAFLFLAFGLFFLIKAMARFIMK